MMVKEGLCLIVFILYANIDAAAHPDVSWKCKILCSISKTARVKKLFKAITSQDSETFQYLIEIDPHLVEAYDEEGNTPLLKLLESDKHTAEFWQRNIPFLLGFGADVNASDLSDRWTPLLRVTYHNQQEHAQEQFDIVRLLVQRGAEVNCSREQDVALMFAAGNGRSDIVEFLLESRADKTLKDRRGKTAADLARLKGHEELATYIENFKAGDSPRKTVS